TQVVSSEMFGAASLDTQAPSVLSITGPSSPTSDYPIGITITFDEQVTNFEAADLTVGNGTASNLTTSDSITWMADITPSASGQVTVDFAADVLTDFTGNGNQAATQFSIDYTPPQNALDFAGDNDFVAVTRNQLISGITFETWVNTISTDATADYAGSSALTIIGDNTNEVGLSFGITDGYVEMHHFNGSWSSVTGITQINDGAWHHVAMSHEPSTGTVNIYVDGTLDTSGSITWSTNPDYHSYNRIGANYNATNPEGDYFQGQLDDLRIWNSVRTESEIVAGLTTQITTAPDLVAAYDFNSSSGTSLADISGNGNTGTLTGFALAGGTSNWVTSTVPVCAPNGKFTGTTDSDWNDPANWCGGVVPTLSNVTEDVIISQDANIAESEDLILDNNNFIVQAGARLDLNLGNNILNLQNGATFTNDGTVFFAAGTQINDPSGDFINNGLITGFPTFNNNFINQAPGTVAPGASPGCTNFAADFTNIGTLEIEVDGVTPCTEHDQLIVVGTAFLGGTLDVTLGYTPTSGDEIVIIDAGTVSGTFTTVNLPSGDWTLSYDTPLAGQVSIQYIDPSAPLITGEESGSTSFSPFEVTIAFSGTVFDFEIEDLVFENAIPEFLFTSDNITYTVEIFPINPGTVTVELPAGVASGNLAANFSILADPPQNALATGGTTDYMIAYDSDLTFIPNEEVDDYTIEAWFKSSEVVTLKTIAGFTGDDAGSTEPHLQINIENNALRALVRSSSGGGYFVDISGGSVIADQWHHAALSKSGSDYRMYLDGKEVAQSLSTTITDDPGDYSNRTYFIVGAGWNGFNVQTGTILPGEIDEVRVWDVAKSQSEIANGRFGLTDPSSESNLTLYYSFNQETGEFTEVADLTGNSGISGFLEGSADMVSSDAQAPVIYQATNASTDGFTANWFAVANATDVTIDIDDDADFLSPFATDIAVNNPTAGSFLVAEDLSTYVNQQLYYRLHYEDGGFTSPYSDVVEFMLTPGNTLNFAGDDDYVNLGDINDIDGQTAITFEAWINLSSFEDFDGIISTFTTSSQSMDLILGGGVSGTNQDVFFRVGNGSNSAGYTTSQPLVADTWHHIAAVFDGSGTSDQEKINIYVDGVQQSLSFQGVLPSSTPTLSSDVQLGRYSTTEYLTGSMDEVRIWSTARSESEIQDNLYNTLTGNEAGLVAYYRFDQGLTESDNTGITTLPDLAGNNDGSLENFDLTDAIVPIISNWVASEAMMAPGPAVFNATQVTTTELVVDFTAPSGAVDVVVDVSEDPSFMSVLYAEDVSVGTTGYATVNVSSALSEGLQYYYRAKTVYAGGAESDYVISNAFMVTPGNALGLESSNSEYVTFATNPVQGDVARTVEAWIKTSSSGGQQTILQLGNGGGVPNRFTFTVTSSGNLNIQSGVQALTGSEVINDGQWHHVAVVYDPLASPDMTLYVDGDEDGSADFASSLNTANSYTLGATFSIGSFFDGSIDELRIWSVAKSEIEIQNNRFKELVGNDTGLEAYHRMDELFGTTISDLTNNGYDGTLNNQDGDEWVNSDAMKPQTYQATDVSVNGFRVNWRPITTAAQVWIDWDTDTDFSDATFVDIAVSDPTAGSFFVAENLSTHIGQPLYYRLKVDNGGVFSPYSEPVEFWVTPGYALEFNGTTDYIDVGNVMNTSYTKEAWVLLSDNNGLDNNIISGGTTGNHALFAPSSFNYQLSAGHNGSWTLVQDPDPLPFGKWQHVALTYDAVSDVMTLYRNGIQVDQAGSVLDYTGGNFVSIGAHNSVSWWGGQMDEIRVWTDVRTPSEIQSHLYTTLSGQEEDLLFYYRFDETSGTVVEDLSPNGNDGTTSGFSGDEWITSGALAPVQYQISEASDQGFRVNWGKFDAPGNVLVDVNDASDFSGTTVVNVAQVGTGSDTTGTVTASLSANQQYFARIYIEEGDFQSAYSDTVSFYAGPGNALDFDGANDKIVTAYTLNNSGDYTIEAWFKDEAGATGNKVILSGGDSWWLGTLTTSGVLRFTVAAGQQIDGSINVRDNSWHHVAVTKVGTTYSLYLDGVLEAGPAVLTPVGNNPVQIGSIQTTSFEWTGELDEIRIWEIERSLTEIEETQFSTLSGNENGLVAYYRFDEGTGSGTNTGITVLPDLAGSNDGDLGSLFALSGTSSNWVTSTALTSTTAPSAPDSLIVYRASATELTLEWNDQSNDETKFIVERADNFAFNVNIVKLDSTGTNGTSITIEEGADISGYYRVSAANANGSSPSDVIFAQTDLHPGQALSFDGTDDDVMATNPDLPIGNEAFSIEAWIKPSVHIGNITEWGSYVTDQANGFLLGTGPTSIGHYAYANDLTIPIDDLSGSWHHVAVSYDGTTRRLFLDGLQIGSDTPGVLNVQLSTLIIGHQIGAGGRFNGEMDEVRIWNIAKTDFSDRFQSLNGNESGLVAYYPMDEGTTDALVIDRSLNTNNGTPAGSPTYTPSGAIAPVALVATDISNNQIDLTWTDNIDNETGFFIERSDDGSTGWAQIGTTNADETTYTDLGGTLVADNDYFYRARAELPGAVATGYTPVEAATTRLLPGNALTLDGSTEQVTAPDPMYDFGSALTLEAWVFIPSDGVGAIISHFQETGNFNGFSWEIGANTAGVMDFYSRNTGDPLTFTADPSATAINDNAWHHVAVTYDGANIIFYIDGVASAPVAATSSTIGSAENDIHIGIDSNPSPTRALGATIDEVRIWDLVRTPTEIANNVNKELTGTEPGLVAYYQFDEESGTEVWDRTANLNNATNTDATIVASGAMTGSVPQAATDVIAYKVSDTQIQVEWTDNTGEAGYRILAADDFDFTTNARQVGEVGVDETSFVHDVSQGEDNFYQVLAYSGTTLDP
ncbi:MAG: LamG-like jellyroll fold domain-containing protein, partial [Cyclobacteriaceae bacterium]